MIPWIRLKTYIFLPDSLEHLCSSYLLQCTGVVSNAISILMKGFSWVEKCKNRMHFVEKSKRAETVKRWRPNRPLRDMIHVRGLQVKMFNWQKNSNKSWKRVWKRIADECINVSYSYNASLQSNFCHYVKCKVYTSINKIRYTMITIFWFWKLTRFEEA